MKHKSMLLAAGLLAAVDLDGSESLLTQTPAQIAANVCIGVHPEINVLTKSGDFTRGTQATLTKQVQPNALCASGCTVTTVNTQKLMQATVPVGLIVTSINTALSLQPATSSTTPAPTAASAVLES
ncbi:hypothetical protein M3A49_40910 [Paraburkholderia sp. CNPSo 3076]|uniref:hypothetical protein n=1 Tax=Paraburkholderia sp. CNPSo 3076 TaxID=2940936 RepID=UPI00225255BC|nr:hypothetical protein [Paraburkholderia sp. CNPSo 3076]MCX5545703.1 hypothetical protein [Paraburkholderia sp. CNPSo 3076]